MMAWVTDVDNVAEMWTPTEKCRTLVLSSAHPTTGGERNELMADQLFSEDLA
jgi:hypothetical protein